MPGTVAPCSRCIDDKQSPRLSADWDSIYLGNGDSCW
jgi:hypothetical protein